MDEEVHVTPPLAVGQPPKEMFAVQQSGVFKDGKRHTHIELTTSKARVDEAVETIKKYGSPEHKYKVFYGEVTWESELEIVPDAAPKQLGLLGDEQPRPRKKK